jgi:hypothetical protein
MVKSVLSHMTRAERRAWRKIGERVWPEPWRPLIWRDPADWQDTPADAPCQYIAEMYAEGDDRPSDCLPEAYATPAEAYEAAAAEVARVTAIAPEERMHGIDWAHRFTLREVAADVSSPRCRERPMTTPIADALKGVRLSRHQADMVRLADAVAGRGDAQALRVLTDDGFRVSMEVANIDTAIAWRAIAEACQSVLGALIDPELAKAFADAQAAVRFSTAPTDEQRKAYRLLADQAHAAGVIHWTERDGAIAEVSEGGL